MDKDIKYTIQNGKLTFEGLPTQIPDNSFKDNRDIFEVTIPESVEKIGKKAFENCANLTKVEFLENSKLEVICDDAFSESGIKTITLPKSVTHIYNSCFYSCRSLEWIKLEKGSKLRYSSANFQNCESLKGVYIYDLADWCKIFFSRHVDNPLYAAHDLYLNDELLENLVIPSGVDEISANCFTNCFSIKSANFGKVKYFGEGCLNGLDNLTDLVLPYVGYNKKTGNINNDYPLCYLFGKYNDNNNSKPIYCYPDRSEYERQIFYFPPTKLNVTILGGEIVYGAFRDCKTLRRVHIAKEVTAIKEKAFWGCSSLTSVTFDENSKVETIAQWSFYKCSALRKIEIPKATKEVQYESFKDCTTLMELTLQNGKLENLSVGSFDNCKSLRKVTIPSTLKKICAYAFLGCKNLTEAYFEDAKGWIYNNEEKTPINSLENPQIAADQLKTYFREHWIKENN